MPTLPKLLCLASLVLAGCASDRSGFPPVQVANETVAGVQSRLKGQGFRLWFPAERAAEPGEVWTEDETGRRRLFPAPPAIGLERSRGASFLLGFSTTANSFSENLAAVIGFLGGEVRDDREQLERLQAALERRGVTKFHFRFGPARVRGFDLDSLSEVELEPDYRAHVTGTDRPGIVLRIVEASGLVVRVTFADVVQEADARAALGDVLGLELSSKAVDERQFEWTVPEDRTFVIGVRYLTATQVEILLD